MRDALPLLVPSASHRVSRKPVHGKNEHHDRETRSFPGEVLLQLLARSGSGGDRLKNT